MNRLVSVFRDPLFILEELFFVLTVSCPKPCGGRSWSHNVADAHQRGGLASLGLEPVSSLFQPSA